MNYWIGQGFGILATITDISIPQFKQKWQMLVANILVNSFLALNLIFLNRVGSGIFMFAVAVAQAVVNLIHTLRNTPMRRVEFFVFLFLYLGLGFYGLVTAPGFVPGFNSQNTLELLPIIGAVLSMCFVSTREENKARCFLLGCTSVWSIYHAIIGSTSFFGSFFSVISCSIALWRNRKKVKA